jgi:hypothetical protein
MTGDQDDMLARLKSVLPSSWFADQSPVLDALLAGLASAWQRLYTLLDEVKAQTRIVTASGVWLDIIADDFFGQRLRRRISQADDALRRRIQQELLRERGTRGAVVSVLQDLTGRMPFVFEPARTTDTGGYGSRAGGGGGLGYGMAGGWGSLSLPMQCFVTAFRPHGAGIAAVAGWGMSAGGYGMGAVEYASLAMVQGQVTDADIYGAVESVLPVTAIAWTQISN